MAEIAQYLGTGKRKTSVARVILRPGLVVGPGMMGLHLLGLFFVSRYRITREYHQQVLAQLAERARRASTVEQVTPGASLDQSA